MVLMPASTAATRVTDSGWMENTARSFFWGLPSHSASPFHAWYWRSDWTIPNSRSPFMMAFTLNTDPAVDSTVTRRLYSLRFLLTILLMAPPVG